MIVNLEEQAVDNNLARIGKVSRVMKTLCGFMMGLIPLALIVYWVKFNTVAPMVGILQDIPYEAANLTWMSLVLGFLASAVLVAVVLYGLYRLRRLFELYGDGQVFTPETAGCLRGFAVSVLLYGALSPVIGSLLSVILTIGNPPGQRVLSVTLTATEIQLVFLGAVLLVISWVMSESFRLAKEYAGLV
jgi:hypothetical protein